MIILGIETSCDETSVAVLRTPQDMLCNVVHSQQDLHGPYGGVVPEIASRSHLVKLPILLDEALSKAGLGWGDIDAVAVTYGPGLASSLLVGVSAAKGLATRLGVPLIPVNHLHGHIFSAFLAPDAPSLEQAYPFVAMVVSGGHTSLVEVRGPGEINLLGQTIDDAAGEAFDKGASLLGLGYPGGPVMDRMGRQGDPKAVAFPRTRLSSDRFKHRDPMDPLLSFSYSGLKTSLMYHVRKHPEVLDEEQRRLDVVASYQEAIVDTLADRCVRAMQTHSVLAIGGGVSLNSRLRSRLEDESKRHGWRLLLTPPAYCADNAGMIAFVAGLGLGLALPIESAMCVDATPSLSIDI